MRSDQVRIKLHITKADETAAVKNLWMCLNYDKKPTIEHICQHIKETYVQENKEQFCVKLYLDDYWLPSNESSVILRENDVVKVELVKTESKCETKAIKKIEENLCKNVEKPAKLVSDHSNTQYDPNAYAVQQPQLAYYMNGFDYANYNDYYKNYASMFEKAEREKIEKNKNSSKSSLNSSEQNTSLDSKDNQKKSQKIKSNSQQKPKQINPQKSKPTSCYKKFSIGNYAHLLNENVQEPVRDNGYTNEEQNNSETNSMQKSSKSVDIDKIASNLKSSGQAKWKNSSKSTNQMSKHIRFPSSSSESSSSSSDSSSDEDNDQTETNKSEAKNNFYEPSKEEQLNAVSKNKSYIVKNPNDLDKFNKAMNSKQLNAPKAENFIDEILSENQNVASTKTTPKSSPKKERRSPSPKVDYEKFQSLNSAPRINDKIAFKILEISSSFTPEISSYKSGQVVDFDSETNEVTMKLFTKYNSILKRSSKFSVVLDETDDEITKLKQNENRLENELDLNEQEEQEMLKVDWRNLIDIKLLPREDVLN
ncbi:coilin-like isoform X2 [Brachionus plicatilis]|uniref:Coilin-like isoform X2 n=1 Tax=Brachionus plicatilis TaxID=10195 RepID=A0A3M7RL21_BRAPC|nr:coilin-like isoform X2 [Brachionus plicatilis]